MLDKPLQGQNPLLGLLAGTSADAQPTVRPTEPGKNERVQFKQVLDRESQANQAENADELNPLEDIGTDAASSLQVTAQQANENQANLENGASLLAESVTDAASLVTGHESLLAQALATTVDLATAPNELPATNLGNAAELTPLDEQAAGVLDPTSSGQTVLNSESVQRLNLLREQNGAPQLSVGTQSSTAALASEPTFPVLFPAQDTSAQNLGVIPTEETPTAKSVLGAQTNVAAEQALDSQLVANADTIQNDAASAGEELPEQVVQEATTSDQLGSLAGTKEAAKSQNLAGPLGSSVKSSGEGKGQEVTSLNTLPTTNSPAPAQSNELSATEQLTIDISEESLEADAESDGSELEGDTNSEVILEVETHQSDEAKNSIESFAKQIQSQKVSSAENTLGSSELRSVASLPESNLAPASLSQMQSASTVEKAAVPQATQFQASVAEAQGHGVVDQISQPLREHVALQRDGTLKVNLEPAELGRVSITVQRTADGLAAQLVAAESLTTELLITQQQDLKDTLVNFGFDEVHVDVSQRDDNDRTGERTDSRRQDSDNNQFEEQQDVVEDVNTSSGTINLVA